MKVTLIAHTRLAPSDTSEGFPNAWEWLSPDFNGQGWGPRDADYLAEFGGRSCYAAWERKNPATATNAGYLRNILDHAHLSVLEHSSVTFYVVGVSRYLTHELVRHRHLQFSQRSTRYVNETGGSGVVHPGLAIDPELVAELEEAYDAGVARYERAVTRLAERGATRKEAREAARFFLPANLATDLVVTANHRAYREMLAKRWHVAADAEIRELAGEMLRQLREVAPHSYADFPSEPFSYDRGQEVPSGS